MRKKFFSFFKISEKTNQCKDLFGVLIYKMLKTIMHELKLWETHQYNKTPKQISFTNHFLFFVFQNKNCIKKIIANPETCIV